MALASAGVAGVVAIFLTSPVRMRRLTAFLDPTLDLTGANHQASAGMFAIASAAGGEWTWREPAEVGQPPEAHTDFIFAVLGEEFGLFGSLVVLAMIGILGYAGIRIASHADDLFVRFAAGGITTWFMVQALINLAVVLRMLPIAGVPLPLVSYGARRWWPICWRSASCSPARAGNPRPVGCWPARPCGPNPNDDGGRLAHQSSGGGS